MPAVGVLPILGLLTLAVLPAQDTRSFEVASIRPVTNGGYGEQHQGIKIDGQIADFGNLSLTDIVAYAFHVHTFQIIGPKEMNARFSIMAKLPDGANADHAPEMIAQLLLDRFHMKFHKESREFSVYAMITEPKGPKLIPAPADYVYRSDEKSQKVALTMDRYATVVAQYFEKPVLDETGLPGKYLIGRQHVRTIPPRSGRRSSSFSYRGLHRIRPDIRYFNRCANSVSRSNCARSNSL